MLSLQLMSSGKHHLGVNVLLLEGSSAAGGVKPLFLLYPKERCGSILALSLHNLSDVFDMKSWGTLLHKNCIGVQMC